MKKHPKHWYKLYYGECPVCGRDSSYKERVYEYKQKKPKNLEDRIVYIPDTQTYDHCLEREAIY